MDSRDIKEEPRKIEGDKYLEEIYSMQKDLLSGYIGIEGLPQYPIDINTKVSQTLLKDFTSRIVEELSEGYESFQSVDKLIQNNLSELYIQSEESNSVCIELLNHLQNANEENADAVHFFIELLIYANIQPDDILAYIEKWLSDNVKDILFINHIKKLNGDILRTSMAMGIHWILKESDIEMADSKNTINIWNWYLERDSDILPIYNLNLLRGGKMYNHYNYTVNYPYLLWKVTHHLNIARNFLKNKPWKQSQVMTQELKYQAELVKAFIYFCGYLALIGLTSPGVFYIYFKKNHVNRFRQKSKY